MKTNLLTLFIFFILLSSCSPSDDNNSSTQVNDYYPLTSGNFWIYEVSGTDNLAGRDSLYVANDTVINTIAYKNLKTKAAPFGFFSNSAGGNSVRKNGDKLLLTGTTNFDLGITFPLDLDFVDLVVFKESAASNEQLSSVSGTILQELEGIPLKFDYVLKTTALADMTTFTAPDQMVYNDLKLVKIAVSLTVSAEIFPGTFVPVLATQEVVNATVYFAKDIGVVYTDTVISYELGAEIAGTLGIPQSFNQTSKEVLDIYQVD